MTRIFQIACLLLVWESSAHAAPGETSLDFLNLGFGARQVAMGQSGTAAADDVAGAYLNPAGLAHLPRHEVSFLYSSHFADITYQHLGYGFPTLRYGAFAASLFSLDYGSIAGFDATGTKTSNVQAWDRMLSLGYAKTVWKRTSLGAGLRYIQEKLGPNTGQAFSLDMGVLHRPWDRGRLSGLRLGLSLKNLSPGVKFDQKTESLPLTIQTGLAYKALQDSLTLAVDAVKTQSENLGFRTGGELWVKDVVALRAGFNSQYGIGNGFSFGAGIKFMDFQLDYAFVGYSDLGDSNKVGLTYRFGSVAETHYSRGLERLHDGKYAEAIMEFDKALTLQPKHERALLRMREAHEKLKEKFSNRVE